MHSIFPDICNQNVYLISATLHWVMYSTVPNGLTLNTEKSQTFKND